MPKIAFRTLTTQSRLLEPTLITSSATQNKIERRQRTALSGFMANPSALKRAMLGRQWLTRVMKRADLGPRSGGQRLVDLRSPAVSVQLSGVQRRTVNEIAQAMGKVAYRPTGHPKWKVLQKGNVPLEPAEAKLVRERKAIWNMSQPGGGTKVELAVSKAVVNGRPWYYTYTHRAVNTAPSLKGAIGRFHKFIKSTA